MTLRVAMLEVVSEELHPGLVAGDRFRLERRVGSGGMGEVWAATHLVTQKPVALKFLSPERASDSRSHARILREARAAATVRHDNVATIHDVGALESGLPFLVMDLLEGETLAELLRRDGKLPARALAPIALQIVAAVEAAHAVGVVHRDLKPDNVFLCPGGVVKVLDFGVAKLARAEEPTAAQPLTTTGEVLGTSFYMAPEQLYAESDVDGRADVWSLGVTLYEALAGVVPTRGESVGQVLKAITTDDAIAHLSKVAPEVPEGLARCVMRMLSRDRAARPALGDVKRALEDARDGRARSPRATYLAAAGGAAAVAAAIAGLALGGAPPTSAARAAAPFASTTSVVVFADAPLRASAATSSDAPATATHATSAGPTSAQAARPIAPEAVAPRDGGATPTPPASGMILTHERR